jgi:formylglycine-generating enzyme required for sulfatase activity
MPNQLGLCDMSGNVEEWYQDWWDEDYYAKCAADGTVKNPPGAEKGSFRGGSWDGDPRGCRSAFCYNWLPDDRGRSIGFRLCLVFSEVGVSDASREQRSQDTP